MNQHYENIHRYDFLTKELLEEEYLRNGLSDQQIADKYEMPSKAVVWRKRKKFGIENRYSSKSNKHAKCNRKFNITKEKALALLEEGKTYTEIAEYMGCSLIVVKRRLHELGLTETNKCVEKYTHWDVKLTPEQRDLIIGSTLGDGCLLRQGSYSCSHSVKQEEYHKHKMDVLASIHSGTFQHSIHKAKGVNGKNHESLHFTTGANASVSEYRSVYYPNGIKVFPYIFALQYLNARSIAYWYMDDGSYDRRCKHAIMCTYGYTALEQILMKEMFLKNWGITCAIHTSRKRPVNACHNLFFTVPETPKLFGLIRPYVIPSMQYKLGPVTPEETAYVEQRQQQRLELAKAMEEPIRSSLEMYAFRESYGNIVQMQNWLEEKKF